MRYLRHIFCFIFPIVSIPSAFAAAAPIQDSTAERPRVYTPIQNAYQLFSLPSVNAFTCMGLVPADPQYPGKPINYPTCKGWFTSDSNAAGICAAGYTPVVSLAILSTSPGNAPQGFMGESDCILTQLVLNTASAGEVGCAEINSNQYAYQVNVNEAFGLVARPTNSAAPFSTCPPTTSPFGNPCHIANPVPGAGAPDNATCVPTFHTPVYLTITINCVPTSQMPASSTPQQLDPCCGVRPVPSGHQEC